MSAVESKCSCSLNPDCFLFGSITWKLIGWSPISSHFIVFFPALWRSLNGQWMGNGADGHQKTVPNLVRPQRCRAPKAFCWKLICPKAKKQKKGKKEWNQFGGGEGAMGENGTNGPSIAPPPPHPAHPPPRNTFGGGLSQNGEEQKSDFLIKYMNFLTIRAFLIF